MADTADTLGAFRHTHEKITLARVEDLPAR